MAVQTNDALDRAAEAQKFLDMPISPFSTGGAEYQYSDWMNNWYLKGNDGNEYVFIPESFVNKGAVLGMTDAKGNPGDYQFYNPAFLKSETYKDAAPYTYWDTDGYVWKVEDAIDNGILRGAGDPSLKSYRINADNPALAGIGKPTYAPGEYQSQICYISQPKQLDSSHAQQNFVSTNGTRYIGSLGYEYVHQGAFWNTVRKVLPTINMLAPVLLDVFVAPGTGAAFGIGSAIGTGISTGDWEKGIINAAKLYAIQQGSSAAGNFAGQEFANFGDLAKSIVQTGTANAVTATLLGRDPVQGFISGGIAGAVGAASKSIDGFNDLPVPVQKMFAAGMGSVLQGKTADQVDQAVITAAVRSGLEAMGNSMDASKYFEEKIGRAPTTDELNNFTWYTNRNALQSSLDNYAKINDQVQQTGVPLTNEQIRSCLSSPDPVQKAQTYIKETQEAVNPAPAPEAPAPVPAPAPEPTPAPTPEPAPEPTPAPAPTTETTTPESPGLPGLVNETPTPEAPPPEGTPTTPIPEGINLKDYPVQDMQFTPENLQELQDILSEEKFQGSQWQQDGEGGYTMVADDGSTLTIHADGSISSTEATDTPYLPDNQTKTPGIKITPGTTAGTTAQGAPGQGTPGQDTTVTETKKKTIAPEDLMSLWSILSGENYVPQTQTQQGTQGQTAGAKVKAGGPSQADINYLGDLGKLPYYLDALDEDQSGEGAQTEPGRDAGAITEGETPPPGRLKNIGGGPGYGPGYVSSGPVRGGGGGGAPTGQVAQGGEEEVTMDQIVKMLRSSKGSDQYASQKDAETQRLIQALQSAGLEDQSEAETQRLANAYGPVAVGQAPAITRLAQAPVAKVATPAPIPNVAAMPPVAQPQAIAAAAESAGPGPAQRLQEYITTLQRFGANEEQLSALKSQLANMLAGTRQTKQQGTTAYKDMFGNIRTY